MYTLEQIKNRIVWVICMPRSGSNWFKWNLCVYLKRYNHGFHDGTISDMSNHVEFFKNRKQESEDYNRILNTHLIRALESINNYTNPIIIRTQRKNLTEQFLSLYITRITGMYNVSTIDEFNKKWSINQPLTIPIDEVYSYIENLEYEYKIWDTYSSQYENETVYYEDLLSGWESKIIPIKLNMTHNDSNKQTYSYSNKLCRMTLPIKIPYNKKEIISNYDQIEKIFEERFGEY